MGYVLLCIYTKAMLTWLDDQRWCSLATFRAPISYVRGLEMPSDGHSNLQESVATTA